MKKQLKNKTIKSIKKVYDGLKELNELWQENGELNFLENSYPFDGPNKDFSTLTSEVGYWLDYHIEYLGKK